MNATSDPVLGTDSKMLPIADWQGRSGRHYLLAGEYLHTFTMRESDLYIIASGSQVLWVGSSSDLVADPNSRRRFRLALDGASQAFRLDAPEDRFAATWDLEGASPAALPMVQAA